VLKINFVPKFLQNRGFQAFNFAFLVEKFSKKKTFRQAKYKGPTAAHTVYPESGTSPEVRRTVLKRLLHNRTVRFCGMPTHKHVHVHVQRHRHALRHPRSVSEWVPVDDDRTVYSIAQQ